MDAYQDLRHKSIILGRLSELRKERAVLSSKMKHMISSNSLFRETADRQRKVIEDIEFLESELRTF
jgi:hypothetical protein